MERDHIYPRERFNTVRSSGKEIINYPVGFFPFNDHNPCPIKLILEFCIDICIYLTKNPDAVAAIHCKAGKGRTGVMIICYLIFTGLCETSDEAIQHYGRMRTLNEKGVTIPSQIRFIKYFEEYLMINFTKPYIHMIPKMIEVEFSKSLKTSNMINNFIEDKSYFLSPNQFHLNWLKIGPFKDNPSLQLTVLDNESTKLEYTEAQFHVEHSKEEGGYFFFLVKFPFKN